MGPEPQPAHPPEMPRTWDSSYFLGENRTDRESKLHQLTRFWSIAPDELSTRLGPQLTILTGANPHLPASLLCSVSARLPMAHSETDVQDLCADGEPLWKKPHA